MRRYWTDEEDAIVSEMYPENGAMYCTGLLDRTYSSVRSRARTLGLFRTNVKWSEYEIGVIHKYYPKWGVAKCKEFLPNRAEMSIAKKAQDLGVKCDLITQRQILGLRTHNMPKGFYLGSEGYYIYTPTGKTEDRVLYHRFIMEQHLGRKLSSDEIVHHRDENKLNNDITNLEIMTRSEHASHHHGKHLRNKVS